MRAAGDEKPQISGYAAVFDQATKIGDFFTEIIKPGAFTRALQENQDVRALINHDSNLVLGRTKSKTLRLTVDAKGLRYEIDPPNTTIANDLRESIIRGDIDQSSFAFVATKQLWREEGDQLIREIIDVDLYDVSAVTYPAYDATSVSARSLFPDGDVEIPEEFRKKTAKRCACDCAECEAGNCAECSNADCDVSDCAGCMQRTSRNFKELTEMKMRLAEKI
jgi:HK97 family phage prohead protease